MSNRFFPNHDTYRITSPFGMRTLKGVTKMHNGIDLVAKTASGGSAVDTITAHTGGTVCAAGFDGSAGNYIKIQTAPDVVMVYYHLRDKVAFRVGDTVRKGDTVGFMGSTGNSTGAHLHFGIQAKGQWIDPAPWLDSDYPTKLLDFQLPVLKRGAKGETVKALQSLLNGLGHSIDIDGSFGPATEKAVKAYQQKQSLEADGSVGRATWTALLGL